MKPTPAQGNPSTKYPASEEIPVAPSTTSTIPSVRLRSSNGPAGTRAKAPKIMKSANPARAPMKPQKKPHPAVNGPTSSEHILLFRSYRPPTKFSRFEFHLFLDNASNQQSSRYDPEVDRTINKAFACLEAVKEVETEAVLCMSRHKEDQRRSDEARARVLQASNAVSKAEEAARIAKKA
ncbi:hypothetical protein R1flu_014298 [Riccia fluitans]|uniref:Uncharacterized protein n=1 Tax=Riccia fluitans TaxID=41844 RepID=A0ABD1YFU0_9MARC